MYTLHITNLTIPLKEKAKAPPKHFILKWNLTSSNTVLRAKQMGCPGFNIWKQPQNLYEHNQNQCVTAKARAKRKLFLKIQC